MEDKEIRELLRLLLELWQEAKEEVSDEAA